MGDTAQVLIQIRGDVGDINAKLADLRGNIGKVAAETGILSGGMGRAFGALKGVFAGIVAGWSLVGFALSLRQTAEQIDSLDEMAQKAGIASSELQGLGAVAAVSGTNMEALAKGFKGLSATIVEAQQGGKEAIQVLQTLGATAEDTAGDHSQLMERFLQVADKVSQMEDGYVKTAFVTKAFGRAGMELIPTLNMGRTAIEQMIQKGREWGLVLEDDGIAKIAAFNDHLKEFELRMQGAKNQLMTGMVDGLEKLADAYDQVISKGGFWKDVGEWVGDAARDIGEFLIVMKGLFELLATGIPGIWKVLKGDKTLAELKAELDAVDTKWQEIHREWQETPPPKNLEVRKGEATAPPKPPTGEDPIQKTIDKLRIEEAQLGKTTKEQAVYNSLKEAGFKIDVKTGEFKIEKKDREKAKEITELTERIFSQKQALEALNQVNKRAEDVMKANRTEASVWADQLEDLNDLVNSGKITWEAWAIAVSKINAEMAKTDFARELADLQKMKSAIADLEAKDETPAVEIARMKTEALQEEIDLRQQLLDLMPRLTAEQQSAWNSEAEALEKVRGQRLEQEQIILRYLDVWSGARQGLKSYLDEAGAVADQMKNTVEKAFKGMEDALIDFVKHGKLSFTDLIDSILTDLLRLTIRQNITGPLAAGLGGVFPLLFGGSGGASGTYGLDMAGGDFAEMASAIFHKGGTVGGRSFTIGVNPDLVPRRHDGGLAPNERLTVNKVGERYITEEQNTWLTGIARMMQGAGAGTSINVPVTVEGGSKRLTSDLRRNIERTVEDTMRRQI